MRILKIALLAVLPILGLAQTPTPAAGTEDQVRAFQLGIDTGCRDAGKKKNDPPERVNALCSCVMKTLRSIVPADSWKKAASLAASGRPDLANQTMTPYMSKLSECSSPAPKKPSGR